MKQDLGREYGSLGSKACLGFAERESLVMVKPEALRDYGRPQRQDRSLIDCYGVHTIPFTKDTP
jgi:hypothetical protein